MIDNNTHIVFDLDDTLFKEIDFVKSAYVYINSYINSRFNIDLSKNIKKCLSGEVNFFDLINSKLHPDQNFPIEKYLELYRFHYPEIKLSKDTSVFFEKILSHNIDFSIITDGRSISQRNKIKALGLYDQVKNIIISEETGFEKPHFNNFKILNRIYSNKKLIYIADNTSKDFLAPNSLNWDTICLINNGQNIHPQDFNLSIDYLPKIKVNYLTEINI
ncbi:MAG: HAD family hydrolase [Flavobacteriaceae bacterium]|nr:HAD family hydrolase [Flavobacteriaceae bacterium]